MALVLDSGLGHLFILIVEDVEGFFLLFDLVVLPLGLDAARGGLCDARGLLGRGGGTSGSRSLSRDSQLSLDLAEADLRVFELAQRLG
jgi:hypothetical protein